MTPHTPGSAGAPSIPVTAPAHISQTAEQPALGPSRLYFLAWLVTLGRWGPTRGALRRFDPAARGVLEQLIIRLINRLVESGVYDQWTLESTLGKAIPDAASSVTAEQLAAALRESIRLAYLGIDPADMLRSSIPALAKASPTEAAFLETLERLELLVTRLAQRHVRFRDTLRSGIPFLAEVVGFKLWPACFELALHLAEHGIDPCPTLQRGLPAAAKLPKPEQWPAALAMAGRLSERRIDPALALEYGAPAAAQVGGDFQESLDCVEAFAASLGKNGIDAAPVLQFAVPVIVEVSATAELFRENLERLRSLVISLHGRGLPARDTLQYGLRVSVRGLPPEQWAACMEMAVRLAQQGIDPADTLQYGVRLLAKAGLEAATFETHRELLETAVVRLGEHRIHLCSTFRDSLPGAMGLLQLEQFPALVRTAATLAVRNIPPADNSGERALIGAGPLASLTRQAILLEHYYGGYEAVWRPAVTYAQPEAEPFGTLSATTMVSYPPWIELRPAGLPPAPLGAPPVDPDRMLRLLEARSWLWQFHPDREGRERARQRLALVRVFLPSILEQIRAHGILETEASLAGIYAIGSYPWGAEPGNIDLFQVVEGERKYTRCDAGHLEEHGVRIEIAGWETILRASRGEPVPGGEVLAFRYSLLYGAPLLAGSDCFDSQRPRREQFDALLQAILKDRDQSTWPELGGNAARIGARLAWRQREARSLESFLKACYTLPQDDTEVIYFLETAEEEETLRLAASILRRGFRHVASATEDEEERERLREFRERFGVEYREAYRRVKRLDVLYSTSPVCRKLTGEILAAVPPKLRTVRLLDPENDPGPGEGLPSLPSGPEIVSTAARLEFDRLPAIYSRRQTPRCLDAGQAPTVSWDNASTLQGELPETPDR